MTILDLVPFGDRRFKGYIGDIRNPGDIRKACRGADIAFSNRSCCMGYKHSCPGI
ncbi:MAG: hypothetical protein U5N58_06420 [Actinomycetota bacterium]|nr:hypothetical protein [Actinomycetota bacterium]